MATHSFRRYRLNQPKPFHPTEEEQIELDAERIRHAAEYRKSLVHDSVIPLSTESKEDIWKFIAKNTKSFIKRVDPISELNHTNHVLIKKAGKDFENFFINMNCSWELINSQGKRIFFACETLFDWSGPDIDSDAILKNQPTFDIILVGSQGGGALNIIAHHRKTSVSAELEYIGEIRCKTIFPCKCLSRDIYKVEDCQGEHNYKIKYFKKSRVEGLPPRYRIIDQASGVIVGKITNEWKYGELPPHELWNKYYGISFCDAVPLHCRMLLLGAFFTIIGTKGFYAVNHVLEIQQQEALRQARELEEQSRKAAAASVKLANKTNSQPTNKGVKFSSGGGNFKKQSNPGPKTSRTLPSKLALERWRKIPQAIKKNPQAVGVGGKNNSQAVGVGGKKNSQAVGVGGRTSFKKS